MIEVDGHVYSDEKGLLKKVQEIYSTLEISKKSIVYKKILNNDDWRYVAFTRKQFSRSLVALGCLEVGDQSICSQKCYKSALQMQIFQTNGTCSSVNQVLTRLIHISMCIS